MKKIFSIALLIFCSATFVFAQNDKKAKQILTQVSAKYKSLNSLKADFSYTIESEKDKINETQNGVVFLMSKYNKYRINIAGQEIISDGKNSWTYLKQANEVQINPLETGDDIMNPSQIFTMYEKGFDYLFVEEKVNNKRKTEIIDLSPIDKKKKFFKIRLTIDKETKQLSQMKIFDKNGNKYTYTIKNFTSNPVLENTFFTFEVKKYPGVEVIDLR